MRPAVIWLLSIAAVAIAEPYEEPWVEEEDLEEPYNEDIDVDVHERRRREAYVEYPYEEHIRVKRRCYDEPEPQYRVRRSEDYVRVPRQVHQYEVHEFTDDAFPSSPPFEEMLAASAEHYHRVYGSPGSPAAARYLNPEVSPGLSPIGVPPVASQPVRFVADAPVHVAQFVAAATVPVNANNVVDAKGHVKFVAPPNLASAPLSVPSPAAAAEAPVHGPVPVPSVPVSQPLQKLAGGDLYGSAAHHKHQKHDRGYNHGGGHSAHGDHYGEDGGGGHKGYKSHHHLDKGAQGHKTDEVHRKEYEEAAGKKRKHHDRADHKGSHEEEAFGQRGSHFDEKKGHKKGHKAKGYHNKYHKDEFHKEHKFYDDFHKSGEHHRYGKFHAKHASNESGKKKAHHVNAGHDFVERGKKGYSNKGHLDENHQGHKAGHGHEEHNEHHTQHGKKGGKQGGSHWGYETKH